VFGASKVAADIMVQEYGRYFDMPTVCFRGGCLTGPAHAGAELHGFLAYLARACTDGRPYRVYGHKGKQVRDNLHAQDLAEAFWHFIQAPAAGGAVYNMGSGTHSNCSMLEAIELVEVASGRKLDWTYDDNARRGDHIWWISDLGRFQADYPAWSVTKSVTGIIEELVRQSRETG